MHKLSSVICSNIRTRSLRSNLMSEGIRPENSYLLASTIKVIYSLDLLTFVDLLLKEEGLEFREEVVYPDGAVYKGQLKVGTD